MNEPVHSRDAERVSTILPVYNRSAFLDEAVESVLNQTYSQVELILVDDGSTDDTGRHADDLAANHPETIRVLHLSHRGPGPAREAGRLVARGAFLQYLDSDDRLCPDKFERQVMALHRHPECEIAYGRTRLIDDQGRTLSESYKWTGRRMDQLFPALLVDRWWCTHTPLYRKTLCDRIGPWADLRYSQDWEYDARAGALKPALTFVDAVVSEHRQHAGIRQTGHGQWLDPPAQTLFFQSLYRAATQAGVAHDDPEMRHFARWVFAAAREAGEGKDTSSAQRLLALALCAGPRWDVNLYARVAAVVGGRSASRMMTYAMRILGRRSGPDTRRLAWMKEDE